MTQPFVSSAGSQVRYHRVRTHVASHGHKGSGRFPQEVRLISSGWKQVQLITTSGLAPTEWGSIQQRVMSDLLTCGKSCCRGELHRLGVLEIIGRGGLSKSNVPPPTPTKLEGPWVSVLVVQGSGQIGHPLLKGGGREIRPITVLRCGGWSGGGTGV